MGRDRGEHAREDREKKKGERKWKGRVKGREEEGLREGKR
jgi:hypothetical protein